MDNVIRPSVDALRALALALMGVAVAGAMSFFPARSAARLECVEAIRSA